jgi:hypothetical protein
MEKTRLIDKLDDAQKSSINLVMLFAENEQFSNENNTLVAKTTERKFYSNKESLVGFSYKKPISKYVQ